MSNLVNFAKAELEQAGLFDKEKDFYGGETGKAVLELVDCFAKQGHSGMSAGIVISLFKELAAFKPINPILNTPDEWGEPCDDKFTYQNKRFSAVFKQGVIGRPYYLDAIVWQYPDGGAFTGTVEGISSRQYIRVPFIPKTFYIDVHTVGDERFITNREQLKDVWEYYDIFND